MNRDLKKRKNKRSYQIKSKLKINLTYLELRTDCNKQLSIYPKLNSNSNRRVNRSRLKNSKKPLDKVT